MKTYRITNGEGFGKSVDEKVKESFDHFDAIYNSLGGSIAAYGQREYIEISTEEDINSEVMQSIAYNTKIEEI